MPTPTLFLGFVALLVAAVTPLNAQAAATDEARVTITSRGWQLIGDLRLPGSNAPAAAALMLNKAAGDRSAYRDLARHLAERGVASLRLDLPGHGESTNLGRFVPGVEPRLSMIWDSEIDVAAARAFLESHPRIDGRRIAMLGASYSGEEMAEAGRLGGYARAYVALPPGSFSEESIRGIDASGETWLKGLWYIQTDLDSSAPGPSGR